MSWRLAKALVTLRAEVDAAFPERSRISDGTIGNAEHAARSSDHNPWVRDGDTGVVTAIDITHDPAHGLVAGDLAEYLRELAIAGDKRIKYVISNRRIANPAIAGGIWRPYSGPNAHLHHVHLSVSTERKYYDSTATWRIREDYDMPSAKEIAEALRPVIREEVRDLLTKEKLVENALQPWESEQRPPRPIVKVLEDIEKGLDPRPATRPAPSAPAGS